MIKKHLTLLFLLSNFIINAQNFVGNWRGELDLPTGQLDIIFKISKNDNQYQTLLDVPKQGAKDFPMEETIVKNDEIQIKGKKLGLEFIGKLEENGIKGTFKQGSFSQIIVLSKYDIAQNKPKRPQTPVPPFDYHTEKVSFVNNIDKNTLAGTLTTPKNKKDFPVFVMITGSGAQNRDEELFDHKPFAVIADFLAKNNIATLRLDDRGVGKSSKGKDTDTSENFATDISTAVDYLYQKGYRKIGLIGHSEGGMIAPMVYNLNKKVKYLVLLAGTGIPTDELLLQQGYLVSKAYNLYDEKTLNEHKKINQTIYTFIKNYKGANLHSDLKSFIDSQSQISEVYKKELYASLPTFSSQWFRYFISFNPDLYLSKVKIPVLALNGSLDLQVPAKENLEGIKKSLTKAQNKNFQIQELEGLNHLFQTAKTGSPLEYSTIEETFSPKALEIIKNWILEQSKK